MRVEGKKDADECKMPVWVLGEEVAAPFVNE